MITSNGERKDFEKKYDEGMGSQGSSTDQQKELDRSLRRGRDSSKSERKAFA